ncbi:MAG: bifunctional serine/threonine-protein kinase/ABC transporter substrate-binding protein [Oscillatoriaceae cyanobacterium Prado104]|jgi:ABC-type branched-subunit amino acid transport system substrate-binding protein/tRNA A-37 threonylcarbamoyl transferase component Bud32|nr:bifunctional serine/threonine-protein kinase/ABC transporter substrate-binding protein [Oscillatoriaceae cyanobacterium Prado104]
MCLNPGDILRDRYEIIAKLGQGGSATTYTATDALGNPDNPVCVVKEIMPPQSTDPEVLQEAQVRFEREAKALKRLDNCLRVPKLIDRFQENAMFYLIQEYIEGQPLSEELKGGKKLNEQQVIDLLSDILEILDCVHSQGIVHRDIKPSNLIRRKDGRIAVIDFGAVKAIGSLTIEGGEITQTRAIGTEGYMPPEQWKNQPRFNSDIYATGIVGIQAIAGLDIEQIFTDRGTCELVWHYSTHDRPLLQISDNLKQILNKMVRFHFSDRYQSAAEVLQDLRSLTLPKKPKVPWFIRSLFYLPPLAVAGIAAGLIAPSFLSAIKPPTCPLISGDALSCGEEILVKTSAPRLKQQGVEEFGKSNYQAAFNFFKRSWEEEDSIDPETLIYMNNAWLKANNADSYTIAVAIPILKNPDGSVKNADSAKELLRGVAQAQTQVNLELMRKKSSSKDFPGQDFLAGETIKGKGLTVVIADDSNLESEAIKTADKLVKQPDILGLVGHYASEMTVAAVDIYDKNNLVLVTSGSTTEELTEKRKKVFFRTSYSSKFAAQHLADYLLKTGFKKAAVLYNPSSSSSSYLTRAFNKYFQQKQGQIVKIREFDLSKSNFNPQKAVQEIQQTGKTAIVLAPDGQVTNSLSNAIEVVKADRNRSTIATRWVMYKSQTLEAASQLKSWDKLVISVPWHPSSSRNQQFPQQAQKLWRGTINTDTALAYDAAVALIQAIKIQQQPSREGMQPTLADPNFTVAGGTGVVKFGEDGDRQNLPSELVHIVKCPKQQFGLAFVPIKYSTAAEAGLKCD